MVTFARYIKTAFAFFLRTWEASCKKNQRRYLEIHFFQKVKEVMARAGGGLIGSGPPLAWVKMGQDSTHDHIT
jgi:hypothetical protein